MKKRKLFPLKVKTDRELSLQSFFSFDGIRIFYSAISIMIEEHIRDEQIRKYYADLNHERATVWQTKKNIPEKVIRAMSKSGFNDYFGYVEFDEECDLEKIKEIEKEFRALNTLFRFSKLENESLRFRKLGNHKASGLYFPTIHCLCVDIRTPSSMAHECFHMMDYMNGMLCRTSKFYPVELAYKEAFEDSVSKLKKEHPFRTQVNGKSKYNREYYFQPMEIFARCGEIYLTRILGVNNSLCEPEDGYAYPLDEKLIGKVDMYFSQLFETVNDRTAANTETL